jgi:hypothetical protein
MSTTAIKPIVESLELDAVASKREAKQELHSIGGENEAYIPTPRSALVNRKLRLCLPD